MRRELNEGEEDRGARTRPLCPPQTTVSSSCFSSTVARQDQKSPAFL
jgi:hypothetical protein